MYYIVQALIILILFSIQTTWLAAISIIGVTPDLVLIFVVFCAVYCSRTIGVGSGIVMGILQDSLSGNLLGVNTFSKGFIGFFFSTLKDKFFVEGILPISFFLAISSLFDGLIFYLSMNTVLDGEITTRFLYQSLPIYSFYNAAIGPVIFLVLKCTNNWLQLKTQYSFMNKAN